MGNAYAASVSVVAATKGGRTEFWAAATSRDAAVAAVQEQLPPGWIPSLTNRYLTPDQVAELNLRPNGVRKLNYVPYMAKHPKRTRDFSQAAKLVIDIATGQVEDREPTPEEQGKQGRHRNDSRTLKRRT